MQAGGNPIGLSSETFLSGSCFADRIGNKLNHFELTSLVNPMGVIFHPLALVQVYKRALENRPFGFEDIFEHRGLWHSYQVHSSLSRSSPEALLVAVNEALQKVRQALGRSSHLVFTFGTAWAYHLRETGQLAANCHKVPKGEFDRKLSTAPEIGKPWVSLIEEIQKINPDVTIIFTVSPVRHIKDGLIENSQSKAELITAVHQLVNQFGCCQYFPAYEIVMDELRDYRYFERDMIHPNQLAVDYIWERFKQLWLDPSLGEYLLEIDNYKRNKAHRHQHPESPEAMSFDRRLAEQAKTLNSLYPHLDL